MKINKLWIVTRPTEDSIIGDICFEVSIPYGLYRQIAGGLEPSEIFGFYTDEKSARKDAEMLLNSR